MTFLAAGCANRSSIQNAAKKLTGQSDWKFSNFLVIPAP